jgi:hypothetical protein
MHFAVDGYPELNDKGTEEKKQAVREFFRSCPKARFWLALPVVPFLAGFIPVLGLADRLIAGTTLEGYSPVLLTLAGAAFGGLAYVLTVPLLVSVPVRKMFLGMWRRERRD